MKNLLSQNSVKVNKLQTLIDAAALYLMFAGVSNYLLKTSTMSLYSHNRHQYTNSYRSFYDRSQRFGCNILNLLKVHH